MPDVLLCKLASGTECHLFILCQHAIDLLIALGNQFEILTKFPITFKVLLLAGELNRSHSLIIKNLAHF